MKENVVLTCFRKIRSQLDRRGQVPNFVLSFTEIVWNERIKKETQGMLRVLANYQTSYHAEKDAYRRWLCCSLLALALLCPF